MCNKKSVKYKINLHSIYIQNYVLNTINVLKQFELKACFLRYLSSLYYYIVVAWTFSPRSFDISVEVGSFVLSTLITLIFLVILDCNEINDCPRIFGTLTTSSLTNHKRTLFRKNESRTLKNDNLPRSN